VSNIISKLYLANRVQAALYALREGLASLDVNHGGQIYRNYSAGHILNHRDTEDTEKNQKNLCDLCVSVVN
jgi:hypothetical protein